MLKSSCKVALTELKHWMKPEKVLVFLFVDIEFVQLSSSVVPISVQLKTLSSLRLKLQ